MIKPKKFTNSSLYVHFQFATKLRFFPNICVFSCRLVLWTQHACCVCGVDRLWPQCFRFFFFFKLALVSDCCVSMIVFAGASALLGPTQQIRFVCIGVSDSCVSMIVLAGSSALLAQNGVPKIPRCVY